MKKPLFLLIVLSINSNIWSQVKVVDNAAGKSSQKRISERFSLSGKITDIKTGESLPGATIYFSEERMGAKAGEQGQYQINNIAAGHHVIEISFSGYATLVEHIELNANTEMNFSLSHTVVENQTVVVTGIASATSIRKVPIPVVSIGRTELLQSASTNIIDALSKTPGVFQLSTGPAISKPVIRGLGYNRVVTVNDGVRQEGQQWGDEHGIEIDELSVAKVEIVKGPASLIYGSDAIAGVVNFISNLPVEEGTIKGNLLTNYQSNSRLYALNGSVAGNKKGISWNAYGTFKSSGDYQNKYDGNVLNSRFSERNFGGYVGISKNWGYSHLIVSQFDQRPGLIEGDRDAATGKFILYAGTAKERIANDDDLKSRSLFIPYQKIRHRKLVSDNSFNIGNSKLKLNLAYQNNQRQEFGNVDEPDEKELFFDLNTLSYTVSWQFPEKNEWHSSIGGTGMFQSNKNKGEEALIPNYNLWDAGLFVYTQRFYKKATLSGGLRFDNRTIHAKNTGALGAGKFNDFSVSFSNFSGSVGISYEPVKQLVLKANIARGFRTATLAELASNGTHEGTNRYEYGDNMLKSEKSLQFDAGIELNYTHFNLGLSLFYNRINDFIFYRKLNSTFGGDSLVHVDGEDITAFQFDQHTASLAGFEFSFDLHPHPLDWLHFENNISFVRGKFNAPIDGSVNLPLVPAAQWNSELRVDFKKPSKIFQNTYANIILSNSFKQANAFTGFGTETATKGYSLLNAGAGTSFRNKNRTIFNLYLAVNNITDVAYQNHLSRLKYTAENFATGRQGVFNAGRNFSVKLNIPLDFSGK